MGGPFAGREDVVLGHGDVERLEGELLRVDRRAQRVAEGEDVGVLGGGAGDGHRGLVRLRRGEHAVVGRGRDGEQPRDVLGVALELEYMEYVRNDMRSIFLS